MVLLSLSPLPLHTIAIATITIPITTVITNVFMLLLPSVYEVKSARSCLPAMIADDLQALIRRVH